MGAFLKLFFVSFLLMWLQSLRGTWAPLLAGDEETAVLLFNKWTNRVTWKGDLRRKETQTHAPNSSSNSWIGLFASNGVEGHDTSPVFSFYSCPCFVSALNKLCSIGFAANWQKSKWFHSNQQLPAGFAGCPDMKAGMTSNSVCTDGCVCGHCLLTLRKSVGSLVVPCGWFPCGEACSLKLNSFRLKLSWLILGYKPYNKDSMYLFILMS